MFNKNSEGNDFLPPWIKFPETPKPTQAKKDIGSSSIVSSFNQQNKFDESLDDKRVPAWNSASSSVTARTTLADRLSRGSSQDSCSKITLQNGNGANEKLPQFTLLQHNHHDNFHRGNSLLGLSSNTDEAEIRLLRQMGWDEAQEDHPLTQEELTTFKNLNYERLLRSRADNTNNNNMPHNRRQFGTVTPQGFNQQQKTLNQNLKEILLATMGVRSEGSDTDEDSDIDSD